MMMYRPGPSISELQLYYSTCITGLIGCFALAGQILQEARSNRNLIDGFMFGGLSTWIGVALAQWCFADCWQSPSAKAAVEILAIGLIFPSGLLLWFALREKASNSRHLYSVAGLLVLADLLIVMAGTIHSTIKS